MSSSNLLAALFDAFLVRFITVETTAPVSFPLVRLFFGVRYSDLGRILWRIPTTLDAPMSPLRLIDSRNGGDRRGSKNLIGIPLTCIQQLFGNGAKTATRGEVRTWTITSSPIL